MAFQRSLPNVITGLRLLAVPVVVLLLLENALTAAFWLIVAAGVSDGLDGFLAKRLDAVTRLGTYLDPIADKLLLVGVSLCLAHLGFLPGWFVALVLLRDLLIIGGVILSGAIELDLKVSPLFVSKVNTFLQIILIVFTVGQAAVGAHLPDMVTGFVYIVTITTILSGTSYLARWSGVAASAPVDAIAEGSRE